MGIVVAWPCYAPVLSKRKTGAPRLKPVPMGQVCTSGQPGRADKCVVAALEFGFVWRAGSLGHERTEIISEVIRLDRLGLLGHFLCRLIAAFDELDALGSGIVRNQINRAAASLTQNVA